MPLTKKDFAALAECLRHEAEVLEATEPASTECATAYNHWAGRGEMLESLAARLARVCQEANPRFNRAKFFEAAKVADKTLETEDCPQCWRRLSGCTCDDPDTGKAP